MPLSDTAIRKLIPSEKARKLSDERGLYLLIQPTGGKLWRFDYRLEGKRKTLSLGQYPDVSLAQASERREEARKLIAQGIDPGAAKQAVKAAREGAAANSFEVIAREWHEKHRHKWTEGHATRILERLEKDVFPWIGKRPTAEVTAPELLATLRRIEARGALDTAHRMHQVCSQVFRYAVATGRAERNPGQDVTGALPPVKSKHRSAITEEREVGELMRNIEAYNGTLVTRCALKLSAYTFCRPGEIRHMGGQPVSRRGSPAQVETAGYALRASGVTGTAAGGRIQPKNLS